MNYSEDLELAKQNEKEIRSVLQKVRKRKPKDVDAFFHKAHDEVFEEIDCLQCANCCKTTSPIFRDVDIKRISKSLRMKDSQFIDAHLKMDDEGDYVLKSSPCHFLNEDNTCSIYETRPLACRDYPHTDRRKMVQILKLTEKNASICPAVSRILIKLVKNPLL